MEIQSRKYEKFYNRILKNKDKFEKILSFINDNKTSINENVDIACTLLKILTFNHTGYFYSNTLEKFFLEIAKNKDIENYNIDFKPKSVLHVITQAYETGGHTRVVERWIDNTKDLYFNFVILLNQENNPIPQALITNTKLSNGQFIRLPDNISLIERGLKLRKIALEYEYIVLHTHMDDPIATIAFGTEKFTRPVLFFNHADHMFWIGKSISDVVLDIRVKKSVSQKYRNIENTKLCPIPCDFSENVFLNKKEARKILDIDINDKIIMTSGSNFKFKPIGNDSIFDVYDKILSANKDIKLIVVGKNKYWDKIYNKYTNRVNLYSEVSFPEYAKYVSCSDLIIDSYPMNGETTLIDAIRAKVPFLSLDTLCSGQSDYVIDSLGYCLTKNEVVEKALKCINNKDYAEKLLDNELNLFNKNYSKENWVANLEKIYAEVPKKHSLKIISEAPCIVDDYGVVLERLYRGKRLCNVYGIDKIFEIKKLKVPKKAKYYKIFLFGKEICNFKINLQKKKSTNIFIFSQNLKLESIKQFKYLGKNKKNIFVTPHYLFPDEREYLKSIFKHCQFRCFADYLTDQEMANCDYEAYKYSENKYSKYLSVIKEIKNNIILKNLNKEFSNYKGYILSNDIGIDGDVWKNARFRCVKGKYYYPFKKTFRENLNNLFKKNFHSIYKMFEEKQTPEFFDEVYIANLNGRKIIFIGKMYRIDYRLNLKFEKSNHEAIRYNNGKFYPKEECQYWTTWHEHFRCNIPDNEKYDVRWIQDGYLPSNYTDYSFCFKNNNVKYYAWDIMGTKLFKNKNLPVSLIPERKKLYMPIPKFPQKVKNILVTASGSGDWTALKNRSDDDLLVYAFSKLAQKYPEINFVYRCHPTWVHPDNVGVNSINRVAQYYESLNLPNLKLSTNIPPNKNVNNFQMSFKRSSLEEDLKSADLVFGEHSISMIDAAFKEIPFASVNLSNRRDLYADITDMGFWHCESIEDIENVIENSVNPEFQAKYLKAVDQYNKMTDAEE